MSGRGLHARAIRFVREVGPAYAIAITIRKIVPARLFYHRHIIVMARDLEGWDARPDADPGLRWAGEQDADLIGNILWDAATVRRRLEEGARVALLTDEDHVLACIWFKTGTVDHDHWLTLVTPEDAVCTMFSFTPKAERGKGHHGRVLGFASRAFARAGILRTLSIVDRLNRNSRWSAEKIGGRTVGAIVVFGIGPLMAVRVGGRWRFGRWGPQRRFHLDFGLFAA